VATQNPFEILRELRGIEWPTKTGWVIYSFAIFLLSWLIIMLLKQIGIALGPLLVGWILGGLQVAHFIAWVMKRNFFYDPDVLTIAFAVATEEASRSYYKEIKKKFREQITAHKLQDDIKVKELPTDVNFTDAKSAEAFILKRGIRLLVWGNTTEGNVVNIPFSQFNIQISYQYRALSKVRQEEFKKDIRTAIQRRMWGVRQSESFLHLAVVSGNILEISLYTLGACLATIPRVDYLLRSIDIFENLQNLLKERKQDLNFPNLQAVKQKTRSLLRDAYTFLVSYYMDSKDLDGATRYAGKAIEIDENNFIAHQNMARLQWVKGNKDQASFHTKRAWHIRPGHPLPRFNKAFFLIINRNYEQALKQYKKIRYVGDTSIVDVIEFLESEFDKAKDNLGLLFIPGWLNIQYADQVRGVAQLEKFLKLANNDSIYSVLIAEASKILSSRN